MFKMRPHLHTLWYQWLFLKKHYAAPFHIIQDLKLLLSSNYCRYSIIWEPLHRHPPRLDYIIFVSWLLGGSVKTRVLNHSSDTQVFREALCFQTHLEDIKNNHQKMKKRRNGYTEIYSFIKNFKLLYSKRVPKQYQIMSQ